MLGGRRLQRLALGPCPSSSECSLIAGPGPALEMGSLGLLILGDECENEVILSKESWDVHRSRR